MVTRSERLDDFVTDRPPQAGLHVQVLAEDHVGTYLLPFACVFVEGAWRNAGSGDVIEVNVIGWQAVRGGLAETARDKPL
jgi:hypothetical protein